MEQKNKKNKKEEKKEGQNEEKNEEEKQQRKEEQIKRHKKELRCVRIKGLEKKKIPIQPYLSRPEFQ